MHDDQTRHVDTGEARGNSAASAEEDIEHTARRAIEYLAYHDPVVSVGFPEDGPPSQQIQRFLAPYLVEIEHDVAELACRYLMQAASVHLGLGPLKITPDI